MECDGVSDEMWAKEGKWKFNNIQLKTWNLQKTSERKFVPNYLLIFI